MLQAILRTVTEILDSKKAAYSFIAAVGASVLHVYYNVSIQDALLLVSPLGVATLSEAHVDAARAKSGVTLTPVVPPPPTEPATPAVPNGTVPL
jgi:hypothetical protein